MQHIRHPQHRHAGKAADAQPPLDLVIDVERRLPQLGLLVYHLLDIGRQLLAIVGQQHAPLDPGKQLHPQFLLQTGHHLADAGLGIVQRLGCFGEAAGLANLQKYLIAVFLFSHSAYPLDFVI